MTAIDPIAAGAPMFAIYQPSEELLQRLASRDVTANDILFYLDGEHDALLADHTKQQCSGLSPPKVEEFFSPPDLDVYWVAMEWWPRMEELPPQFNPPSIYQLLRLYHDHTIGSTFVERLTHYGKRVTEWLVANGYDPARPNLVESVGEKRRRQNAEAQARHRARRDGTSGAEHAHAVADAYRRYMDVCAQRKAAHAAVSAEWDPQVAMAMLEWKGLKG